MSGHDHSNGQTYEFARNKIKGQEENNKIIQENIL